MSDERDWRREAIYWRFLFGDGAAAISQAWDIGLEQVEHELRVAQKVAPAFQPARLPSGAQLVTRPTRTPGCAWDRNSLGWRRRFPIRPAWSSALAIPWVL